MEVIGFVQDGRGQGRGFTQLAWVRQQFRDKLGFDPFPGTLNVRVVDAVALAVQQARPGIAIAPCESGYCAARCYPVRAARCVTAVWILPEVPGYPENLVEVTAPVSLRETLKLNTGDVVSLQFPEKDLDLGRGGPA